MNRFVASGSRSFLVAAWLFLGALFADGANLDDIFASNDVFHDDDVVASGIFSTSSSHDTPTPLPPGRQQVPSPVRVIIDQDSPSLAADTDAVLIVGLLFPLPSEKVFHETTLTAEVLHIKLRTLLI